MEQRCESHPSQPPLPFPSYFVDISSFYLPSKFPAAERCRAGRLGEEVPLHPHNWHIIKSGKASFLDATPADICRFSPKGTPSVLTS